jgi:predicted NUDIX family NTP pyrophosphohydrolase
MVIRRSAGIVLYRRSPESQERGTGAYPAFEVLLGHPGGPFFANRDEGHWTIPKGEPDHPDDDLLSVARREFEEETGHPAPDGESIELGEIRQKGGKLVEAWALEGDLDPATAHSNTFPFQWPPRSGRWITIPEIDRVDWFAPDEARRRIKETQIPFIDRLLEALRAV